MKYLKVFTDFRLDMELLGDAERGRLFTAMLVYAEDGTETELKGNERFLWGSAKKAIDNQRCSYENKAAGAAIARAARSDIRANHIDINANQSEKVCFDMKSSQEQEKEQEQEQEKEQNKKKVSAARFIRPTIDEIKSYCAERGNNVDAERFFDFYASKGWVVGSQPMKDWKAAVRTWEKRDGKENRKSRDSVRNSWMKEYNA